MTDFTTIYDNYLSKLESRKTYSLGSIHNRLLANGIDIEIVFLYLYMMSSKKFTAHFPKNVKQEYETILMERIA